MKSNPVIVLFTIFLSLIACSNKQNEIKNVNKFSAENTDKDEMDFSTSPKYYSEFNGDLKKENYSNSREETKSKQIKIIQTGELSIESKEIFKDKQFIDFLVKKYSGYYGQENLSNNSYNNNYELVIRIPDEKFGDFLNSLEKTEGKIIDKNILATDVTEEYTDIEIRLKNKRAYLQRYLQLLTKANSIDEILKVEEIIRGLEEEIDAAQGRMNFLNDQVDFSTLSIHLFKKKEFHYQPIKQDSFWERAKVGLNNGWVSIVDLVLRLLYYWPLIISIGALYLVIRKKLKMLYLRIVGTKK